MGELASIKEANQWNISRIGEAFRMSRDTVRKRLKEAGIQPAGKKGNAPLYDLADVGPALFAPVYTPSGGMTPDDMVPQDRKAWFQSENERLSMEQEMKQLVPASDMARELSKLIKSIINPLDGLTDTLERRAELSPAQAEVVQAEVDGIREQMYLHTMESDQDG